MEAADDGAPARGAGPDDGGVAWWRPVIGEGGDVARARAKTARGELAALCDGWRKMLTCLASCANRHKAGGFVAVALGEARAQRHCGKPSQDMCNHAVHQAQAQRQARNDTKLASSYQFVNYGMANRGQPRSHTSRFGDSVHALKISTTREGQLDAAGGSAVRYSGRGRILMCR